MNAMTPTVLAALRQALPGPGKVTVEAEELMAYAYDGTWAEETPAVVVHPVSTADVVAVLKVADEALVPVVPRGAGTGLAGGAIPVAGGICLNMARMNRILAVSTDDTLAVAQPGVITYDLQRAAQKVGLMYPPDPASLYQCTIGGNVATNAGGPRCLKYGVTRDYVLGLELVLPGGRVLRCGGHTIKDVAAYNLKDLFLGSEGTLGVVTEITVRLIPQPHAQLTALAAFPRLPDACHAVGEILASGIVPLVTELMDQCTTQAVESFKHLGLPTDVEALLLVAVDGDEEQVQRDIQVVSKVLTRCGARDVRQASTAEESEALWEARRSISPAIARLGTDKLGEDIAVPRSQIATCVERMQVVAKANDVKLVLYGHIGDGNLHPNLVFDRRNPEEVRRVEKASGELIATAVALGGVPTGEHGIGLFKLSHVAEGLGENVLHYMRGVKQLFDPHGIMNPGKKLPA
jgi:glycolate oxidase